MNILSLFDGISCGQIALNRLGVKYENYFASEIDKYAIQITQKNYPKTIQLGSVTEITADKLPKIDLLIGGSPCKDLSFAKNNGEGLDGNQSKLFYEFVRLLNECKPKYFLLENVVPIGNWKTVMDEYMKCTGVMINSSLFVSQNRKRIYWTNIQYTLPEQKECSFSFDTNVNQKYYVSNNISDNIERMTFIKSRTSNVCGCLTEAIARNGSSKEYMSWVSWVYRNTGELRKLTPEECERLQGVSVGYTDGVSDTQRYRMLGNGWTVDVIAHIMKGIQ
jgi:DNA-cytosine methyltransferase